MNKNISVEDMEYPGGWQWSLAGLITIFAVYSFLHSVIRILASNVIGQDDVVGNLFTQVFAAGYTPRQGPLYDWLLWVVQQFTGPYLISFLLLKYALISGMLIFIYLSSVKILHSRMWAFLCALSISLMYQIGWNIHEGVTHTAALMFCIAGSFWGLLKLVETGRTGYYLYFGFMLGLGFLSKHTFGLFVIILGGCCMLQPSLRKRLLHPYMLLSLLMGVLIASPYLLWLLERTSQLINDAMVSTGVEGVSYFKRIAIGLPKVVTSPLGFLFPLIVILPLIFPGFFKTWWRIIRKGNIRKDEPDYIQLISHMMIASLVIITAAVLIFGISRLEERYMHPFFLIGVIAMVGIAMHSAPDTVRVKRYVSVIAGFAIVVLCIRIATLVVGYPLCGKCRPFLPYNELATVLKQKGFNGGTIVTGYRHLAGNMRRLFPEARVISILDPIFTPPVKQAMASEPKDIIAIWNPQMNRGEPPVDIRGALERLGVKKIPKAETVKLPWKHIWRPAGYRHTVWKLIIIPRD